MIDTVINKIIDSPLSTIVDIDTCDLCTITSSCFFNGICKKKKTKRIDNWHTEILAKD